MRIFSDRATSRPLLAAACGLLSVLVSVDAAAEVDLDGEQLEVVDAHVHVGTFGQQAPNAKDFIIGQLPPFIQYYHAASTAAGLDPYGDHIGIKALSKSAGVDHMLLLAVYTQQTTGYFTNRQLADVLTDERNTTEEGEPWAVGMASINFENFTDSGVAQKRLEALGSYFEAYPDRFVGIKLAHAHQQVAFDDSDYYGVYEVAAKHDVPVLLHTGFSPFSGTKKERRYYDPKFLEDVISKYDGTGSEPRVDFILGHTGRGDVRATNNALDLAEQYPNVWLELSALGKPIQIDENGNEVQNANAPQFKSVLAEIKKRDLVSKTIYASDGPQNGGKIPEYLGKLVDEMKAQNFTTEQMRAILAENFWKLVGSP